MPAPCQRHIDQIRAAHVVSSAARIHFGILQATILLRSSGLRAFDYSNTLRRSTAFAEIKQSADGHPHFGSCALHHHRSSMHEPDLGLPHKYRSAGATRVVDRNDRHLCTQPESPHGISAVDLQLPTVLPGNQIHQVPRPRTMNPTSVLTVFRPHVDATIHAQARHGRQAGRLPWRWPSSNQALQGT